MEVRFYLSEKNCRGGDERSEALSGPAQAVSNHGNNAGQIRKPLRKYGSGYFVKWQTDSSAALFYVDGKKCPFHIFVVALKKGHVASLVDLETPIRKLVQASYVHSHAPRFNDYFDFIINDGDYIRDASGKIVDVEGYWSLNDHGQVLVKCICTNDPKHLSKIMWEVVFEGVWDINRSHFAQYNFGRIPQSRIPSLDGI